MFDKIFFAAKIRLHTDSSVVQSVERRTVNPYVTGSSPVRGAKFKKPAFKQAFCFLAFLIFRDTNNQHAEQRQIDWQSQREAKPFDTRRGK